MRYRLLLVPLVAFLATGAASDFACHGRSWPELTMCVNEEPFRDCDGGPRDHVFYVDNDPCQLDGCTASIWIYEETNGYKGLQRNERRDGDEPEWLKDDTCRGSIPADAIIF